MERNGFTLIELVVVTAIIAVLLGLTALVLPSFLTNSKAAATRTTIKKVDAILQDRMTGMDYYFQQNANKHTGKNGLRISVPSYVLGTSYRDDYADAIADDNLELVKALDTRARKDFRRRHFPQAFEEADTDLDGTSEIASSPLGHDPDTESAECLYWWIVNGHQFGSAPVGQGDFSPREIADTDNDGLLEIVDGWGQPLRWYRWPTRLIRQPNSGISTDPVSDFTVASVDTSEAVLLIGSLPSSEDLMRDPEDPANHMGALYTPTTFEPNFHTVRTWHAPLIMSVGEDGRCGLYEPHETLNFGDLAQPDYSNMGELVDNISNLFLRTGGR